MPVGRILVLLGLVLCLGENVELMFEDSKCFVCIFCYSFLSSNVWWAECGLVACLVNLPLRWMVGCLFGKLATAVDGWLPVW